MKSTEATVLTGNLGQPNFLPRCFETHPRVRFSVFDPIVDQDGGARAVGFGKDRGQPGNDPNEMAACYPD
jgi:hypothetical protein